jgi:hypothetical protein
MKENLHFVPGRVQTIEAARAVSVSSRLSNHFNALLIQELKPRVDIIDAG